MYCIFVFLPSLRPRAQAEAFTSALINTSYWKIYTDASIDPCHRHVLPTLIVFIYKSREYVSNALCYKLNSSSHSAATATATANNCFSHLLPILIAFLQLI